MPWDWVNNVRVIFGIRDMHTSTLHSVDFLDWVRGLRATRVVMFCQSPHLSEGWLRVLLVFSCLGGRRSGFSSAVRETPCLPL